MFPFHHDHTVYTPWIFSRVICHLTAREPTDKREKLVVPFTNTLTRTTLFILNDRSVTIVKNDRAEFHRTNSPQSLERKVLPLTLPTASCTLLTSFDYASSIRFYRYSDRQRSRLSLSIRVKCAVPSRKVRYQQRRKMNRK